MVLAEFFALLDYCRYPAMLNLGSVLCRGRISSWFQLGFVKAILNAKTGGLKQTAVLGRQMHVDRKKGCHKKSHTQCVLHFVVFPFVCLLANLMPHSTQCSATAGIQA